MEANKTTPSTLLGHITHLLNDPIPEPIDENTRKQLLGAAEQLQQKFETPLDFTVRIGFGSHRAMMLRLAVDMGLFDALAKRAGVADVAQLAEDIAADELLVSRVMRFLAGMGVFNEKSPGAYEAKPVAAAFQTGSPLSAAVIHLTHILTVMAQLPEYFASTGWKNPSDVYDGPFQFGFRTDKNYFEFLQDQPKYQNAFNTVMTLAHRRRGRNWFDFFPVEEKLQVEDAERPVLVDVGGSQGGDIRAFHARFPDLPGRLVLQDLPEVVNAAGDLPAAIERQGYDFFQEQPVKHAKAYFLRTILHDWPDKQALQILQRVKEAMGPDSLLLLNETVLPESQVPLASAQADFMMMCTFASLERTEKQFESLLDRAGFELARTWTAGGQADLVEQATLLEARVK